MMKLMKKHYMPISAIMIFISVFLYQFFYMVQIPYIKQYSLQDINYLNLLLYILIVLVVVSLIYNIPLLLTIEISQSLRIPTLRITISYHTYSIQYGSIEFVTNRYKSFSVFRC